MDDIQDCRLAANRRGCLTDLQSAQARATTICKTQWHLESNFFHLPRVWVATPAYQYSGNEFELFSTGRINLWYWTESSEYATELRWQQLPLIPQPAGRPSIFYASWRLDIDKLLYSADSSEHTSDWRQYQFRGKAVWLPSFDAPAWFYLHPLFHSSPPTRSLVKVRLKWKLFIFCNFAISDSWYLH